MYDRLAAKGKIEMKKICAAALSFAVTVILLSCGLPDLPGPIGIPGI